MLSFNIGSKIMMRTVSKLMVCILLIWGSMVIPAAAARSQSLAVIVNVENKSEISPSATTSF